MDVFPVGSVQCRAFLRKSLRTRASADESILRGVVQLAAGKLRHRPWELQMKHVASPRFEPTRSSVNAVHRGRTGPCENATDERTRTWEQFRPNAGERRRVRADQQPRRVNDLVTS